MDIAFLPHQVRRLADDHPVRGAVKGGHIPGGGVRQPQAAALAHGELPATGVLADRAAVRGDQRAGGAVQPVAGEEG